MEHGFVPLRRGLLEHLERGGMSVSDLCTYVIILLKADHRTGAWWGSAQAVAFASGRQLNARTAKRSLARLELAGYIKRFIIRGDHGSYPVLINRFRCPDGRVINASGTTDWREPLYYTGPDVVPDMVPDVVPEVSPIQEIISNNKKQELRKPRADYIYESLELKIDKAHDAAWRLAFPHVDLQLEYQKMRAWILSNPSRAPKKNYSSFVQRWLARIPTNSARPVCRAESVSELDIPLAERPY